jgi:adenylate cyclase
MTFRATYSQTAAMASPSVRQGICVTGEANLFLLRFRPDRVHGEEGEMADSDQSRKLTAILSADVVGYARLMQDDDTATVQTLKDYRNAIALIVERHGGRIVNAPGDAVLCELPAAVEAADAALDIQRDIEGRNAELPEKRQMHFRIGLNLDDVIEEADGSLYGDGVNIAARMEALAEAGGVCVSSTVRDALAGRHDLRFEFLGAREIKNIDQPVRVYRMSKGGPTATKPLNAPAWRRVAAAAAALAAVGAVAVFIMMSTDDDLVTPAPVTVSEPEPVREASIAVLPFTNMSGDAEQEYFADGISEDLITELSRFEGLLVIARNSTFRFKGEAVDIAEVAAALGVRYVLEGGVRRVDDRVRITAQLIDTETGGHLWAERYDRELTDVFAVQDDVTQQIIEALKSELGEAEPTRGDRPLTSSPEAYDLYLRGRLEKNRRLADANVMAQELLRQAVDLDPTFAAAYAELSHCLQLSWYYGWTNDDQVREDALAAAQRAVALDRSLPVAHLQLGLALSRYGKFDEAIASMRQAIRLDTNYADALSLLGYLYTRVGDGDAALILTNRAVRHDPYSFMAYGTRGQSYFVAGDYEQAVGDLRSSLDINPNVGVTRTFLIAAYGLLGREDEARAHASELLRLNPNFATGLLRTPYKDRSVLLRVIEGLRVAGLEVPDPPTAP